MLNILFSFLYALSNNYSINYEKFEKDKVFFSQSIENSSIWPTIAKLPVIHPYTDYLPPFSLIAVQFFSEKLKSAQCYLHVQTLLDSNKRQSIRLHPWIHPQDMNNKSSYSNLVHTTLKNLTTNKIIIESKKIMNQIHPNQNKKQLLASPDNGHIDNINWKDLQAFLGIYQEHNKKPTLILHITVPEEYDFSFPYDQNQDSSENLTLKQILEKDTELNKFIKKYYIQVFGEL